MAAFDEDTELRDLVAQTLENNGVLGRIKAQLRASVFLALEEVDPEKQKSPFVNPELRKYIDTANGGLAYSLIMEFLEHFKLEFTKAVFVPECSNYSEHSNTADLRKLLNIPESPGKHCAPLLCDMVERLQGGGGDKALGAPTFAQGLTSEQLARAKERFNYYDQDKNGVIDKEELRCLFIDTFPAFNRNMLDRYVNDEFRAADRDFSSNTSLNGYGIDFNEFTAMYRRLFLQCHSVVSGDGQDTLATKQILQRPKSDINHKSLFEEIVEDEKHAPLDLKLAMADDSVDDPFFDDLLLPAGGTTFPSSRPSSDVKSSASEHTLTDMKSIHDDTRSEVQTLDKKLSEIEYVPTDEYDDDFSSIQSLSARSGKRGSHDGGVEEEIEEDISVECDDLLKSHSSTGGFDDITTDRTISQDNGFDYAEDLAF